MATKYILLEGSISWAQVYEPDTFRGDSRWKITFYPKDGEQWERIRKAGLQLEPKEDNEGNKSINLRRPVKRVYNDETTFFTPPKISGLVDVHYIDKATGEPVRTHKKSDKIEVERVGDAKLLGNGTKVLVSVAVYDTQQGKGHRLESIKVLDLVEYIPPEPVEEEKDPLTDEVTTDEAPFDDAKPVKDKKGVKLDW